MPKVVLDSTVLVSAFLTPGGVSDALLRQAKSGVFHLYLADKILEETQRVLLEYPRIRRRYRYTKQEVIKFCQGLRAAARWVTDLPQLQSVTRDPDDDHIIACALKAKAHYIVTRDQDLLSLEHYQDITILTPEQYMAILRK